MCNANYLNGNSKANVINKWALHCPAFAIQSKVVKQKIDCTMSTTRLPIFFACRDGGKIVFRETALLSSYLCPHTNSSYILVYLLVTVPRVLIFPI